MAISKKELYQIIEKLPESANKSAYDYLKYLSISHSRPDWDEIMKMEPDEDPLNDEEQRQIESKAEFLSWEDAMSELNLPTKLKP